LGGHHQSTEDGAAEALQGLRRRFVLEPIGPGSAGASASLTLLLALLRIMLLVLEHLPHVLDRREPRGQSDLLSEIQHAVLHGTSVCVSGYEVWIDQAACQNEKRLFLRRFFACAACAAQLLPPAGRMLRGIAARDE
jgi:hypothetical protein